MPVTRVNPAQLAPAIAPFPQALIANNLIFISGQIAMDQNNDVVAPGDVGGQTAYIIERLRIILAECGASLEDIVTATVFITSPELFGDFNAVWAEAFGENVPARATVVAQLVLEPLLIEVQATALRPPS